MSGITMNEEKRSNFPSTFTLDNFSSTTKLAISEAKPPGVGKIPNEKDELYNPFEHRDLLHPTSSAGSFFHLLKSSLGTGILAMPNAFKNGGLMFGFFGTIIVGFICTYCVHMLVKTAQEICKKSKIPSLGFSETSGAAFEFGPAKVRKFSYGAKLFVDIALVIACFMGNSVYIVFIAESLKQLFDYWFPDYTLSKYMYMLIIMVGLLIICQVRELKHLVPFSFFANIFMIVSFSITLYYMFSDIPSPSDRDMFTSLGQLPLFFSIVIFAMEGISVVMPIENNMANPQHFLGCPGVLYSAMGIVVLLYSTIGFFGYLKFGSDTAGSITLNLPVDRIPAQVVKLLIALSIFFTYSLQMYVPIDILWRNLIIPHVKNAESRKTVYQIIIRSVFVMGTTAIAALVPDLEPIIGLVGSICFSTLGLLIPAVVETVWKWETDLGKFNWRLYKNGFLVVFSIFALVSGTTQSLKALLNKH